MSYTVLARLLYAAPAWRRFATAQDCSRIDRFINRTVNLGYLPAHCQTFTSLVNTPQYKLPSSVIRNSYPVLRPLFPPTLTRRPGLRKRAHPFTLPLKDDKQCIPRVLYRALLPPVQSQACFPHRFFSIPYSLFTAIISISLSLHLVLLAPVNSCELHNYHLVLSFLFMYSSSGLSADVFFLIKRI